MKDKLPDEQLDALLQEWKVDTEPSPRFSEGVWRRIAQREADAKPSTWIARWQRWMSSSTRLTGFAWGAAASVVVTVASAWIGHQAAVSVASTPTAESYLAAVDPYRMSP